MFGSLAVTKMVSFAILIQTTNTKVSGCDNAMPISHYHVRDLWCPGDLRDTFVVLGSRCLTRHPRLYGSHSPRDDTHSKVVMLYRPMDLICYRRCIAKAIIATVSCLATNSEGTFSAANQYPPQSPPCSLSYHVRDSCLVSASTSW